MLLLGPYKETQAHPVRSGVTKQTVSQDVRCPVTARTVAPTTVGLITAVTTTVSAGKASCSVSCTRGKVAKAGTVLRTTPGKDAAVRVATSTMSH